MKKKWTRTKYAAENKTENRRTKNCVGYRKNKSEIHDRAPL